MIPMLNTILAFAKIFLFFINLWKEKDNAKAKEKNAIGKEIVYAFTATDNKTKASRVNAVIGRINRMR